MDCEEFLARRCCPPEFLTIFRQLHEGQQAQVKHNGSLSDSFPISDGVKQECVLALTLFFICFSIMLSEAKRDMTVSEQMAVSSPFGVSSHARKPSENSSQICCLPTTAPFSPTRRKPYSTSSTASLMQPRTSSSPSAWRRPRCCTNPLHEKRTVLLTLASMTRSKTQWNTSLAWVASI